MNLIEAKELDANGDVVSTRYINTDQIATITVEKDGGRAAVVMSNGDCIVVPKDKLLQKIGFSGN